MNCSDDSFAKIACCVAVVVPAYNAESYIKQTLSSILQSTFRDFVIVVVNDGSTDNTERVVRELGDERIVLVNRQNSGMSASRNFGIDFVDSEFVALCDADDLWHPRKLELQVDLLRTFSGIGLCYTEFEKYYDGDDANIFCNSIVHSDLDSSLSGYIYHQMLLTNWALPSSVFFRRSLWNSLGYFLCQDQQTDDWEYFVRASREFKFAKLKSPLVLYRQSSVSLSRRVPKLNSTELLRNSLISKYGIISPQGHKCDPKALRYRCYVGNRNFYDQQLSRGNFFVGVFGLMKLLCLNGNKSSTLVTFAFSFRRRLMGLPFIKLN